MQQSTIKTLVDWILAKCARYPCSMGGKVATPTDQRQYATALALWGVLLAETTMGSSRDIRPYLGRMIADAHHDFVSVLGTLAGGRDALLHLAPQPPRGGLDRYIPALYECWDAAVHGDQYLFFELNNLCSFLRKLRLSRPELEEEALASYLDNEARAFRSYRGIPEWVRRDLHRIILRWFRDFHISDYRPRHGPGAVAEPNSATHALKWKALRYYKPLDQLLCSQGLGAQGTFVPSALAPQLTVLGELQPVSRLIFVPKTFKSLRTVKPEPATLQWAQKGVQDELYQYIELHPYLHKRIPLTDQGQNRELARQASITGWLATLDLSAASDSVSVDFVRTLFAGTELGAWLEATRSTHTLLPTGEVIPSSIFAGMGSSLCFPVESIVFAAMCELCLEHSPRVHPADEIYSVYGDDIICPTHWVGAMEWLLRKCGFVLNTDKSYSRGHFRESCGMEAFKGSDVTPILYPFDTVPPSSEGTPIRDLMPSFAPSLIGFANRAELEFGFSGLRKAALYVASKHGYHRFASSPNLPVGKDGILVTDSSTLLYSAGSPQQCRWNSPLQRAEVRGLAVRQVRPKGARATALDEVLTYWEWLCHPTGEELDPYTAMRQTHTHLCCRWVGW